MRFIRFAILGLAALLAACLPVTSKHPVGSTVGLKSDPALIGLWKGHGGERDAKDGYFAFLGQPDGTMSVLMFSPAEDDGWESLSAQTATLGGLHVMNARMLAKNGVPETDSGAEDNIVLAYRIEGSKLTLSLLDEKKVADAIQSAKLEGTIARGGSGDVHITAEPQALDAFFASREGAALFGETLVTMKKVD
jgi:hypothetical protein